MHFDSDALIKLSDHKAIKPRTTNDARILCIDDNRDLVDSIVMLLDYGGFEVKACYDGFDGVREAISFRPHVCLIDISMPGINGFDVARMIVCHYGGTTPQLIAITAIDNERQRSLAQGQRILNPLA